MNITPKADGEFLDDIIHFDRILTIDNNIFFIFQDFYVELHDLKKGNDYKIYQKIEIDEYYFYTDIIDFNNKYYCLNDRHKILLLNKNNLIIAKEINLNFEFLKLIKLHSQIVTIIRIIEKELYFENYDILMEGVQLKQKNSKLITIKKKPNSIFFDNNYIVISARYDYYGFKAITK